MGQESERAPEITLPGDWIIQETEMRQPGTTRQCCNILHASSCAKPNWNVLSDTVGTTAAYTSGTDSASEQRET